MKILTIADTESSMLWDFYQNHYLEDIDLILVMSVEPGFGGQKFMDSSLPKISYYSKKKAENGYSYLIEVDGGIGPANAHLVRDAGVEVIVAGSAVFKAADRTEAIKAIKG
jgi:ribulose-phosphate 3-epimerase